MESSVPFRDIRGMGLDNEPAQTATSSKVQPLSPKEIVFRLDSSNRQKFLFEYEKRARDQSTKWQSIWEAHLLALTILRHVGSIPTLSPYPYVAVARWEQAKEAVLGEGQGEFKLVLCDEVGAHFCVVTSRVVNADFNSEKNRQLFSELQREILKRKVCLSCAIVKTRSRAIMQHSDKSIPGLQAELLLLEYPTSTPFLLQRIAQPENITLFSARGNIKERS
jgi:hypothetical protein